ncbi:MAG: LON peptidase substrate-binding domain-containing protein, partial [Usitatibacter sp.]
MNETTNTDPTPVTAEGSQRLDAPASDATIRAASGARPLPEDAMIILPVRNIVLFPGLVVPLAVGRERSRAAAQEALRLERPLGILLQNKPDVDAPGPDDMHWVGTSANVLRYVTAEGTHHAIVKGQQRFRVLQFLEGYPFTVARVQLVDEAKGDDPAVEGRARALRQRAREIMELLPQIPEEVTGAFQSLEAPGQLADFIAGLMDVSPQETQALLE